MDTNKQTLEQSSYVFKNNGYATDHFNNILKQIFDKHIEKQNNTRITTTTTENTSTNTNNTDTNTETDSDITYITIPHYGKHSQQYANKIQKIFKQNKIENIKIAFKMTKIKAYFNHKDKTHKTLKNNIIYKFTCCGDHNNT